MDAQLTELAAQISRQEAYQHWAYWLTLAALVLVGLYVWHFLKSYADKVADIKAQTDKLPEIKAQLAETTRTTEEIKAEVSQKDWRDRERLTLYRTRLEELLGAAFDVNREAQRQTTIGAHANEVLQADVIPLNRMRVIASLYFKQLRPDVLELVMAGITCHNDSFQVNTQRRMLNLDPAPGATPELRAAYKAEHEAKFNEAMHTAQASFREIVIRCNTLENKAMELIDEYVP